MFLSPITRAACGLAAAGIVGLVGLGATPAAHAQSLTPSVSASMALFGSNDVVSVTGAGFTPGGTVTLYVYDSTTGALLQTTPVVAGVTSTTPTLVLVNQIQEVCPPAPFVGPCQDEMVQEPESVTTSNGIISTNLVLPATNDELVVEGADATTGVLSNQVVLTAATSTSSAPVTSIPTPAVSSVPTLPYGYTPYGYTNMLGMNTTGYLTEVSGSNLEIINPFSGVVEETLPLSSLPYGWPL